MELLAETRSKARQRREGREHPAAARIVTGQHDRQPDGRGGVRAGEALVPTVIAKHRQPIAERVDDAAPDSGP